MKATSTGTKLRSYPAEFEGIFQKRRVNNGNEEVCGCLGKSQVFPCIQIQVHQRKLIQ